VGDADAVVDAVLDDGHVKVSADRIDAGSAHAASCGTACHDEGVHFELDEGTQEGSPIEGAGVALIDDTVPFPGAIASSTNVPLDPYRYWEEFRAVFAAKPSKGMFFWTWRV